jgi:NAD(P)-dependent dehydrogenase (short-subunit alcohol dehydrogenase family)
MRGTRQTESTAPGRLTGKRVLVVGAGSKDYMLIDPPIGIGRATSQTLGREGAVVGCVDVNADAASATVDLIRRAGDSAVPIVADVAREDDCERLVDEAVTSLGTLNAIVFNVGHIEGVGLAGTTSEIWDRVFASNVRGAFLVTRAALPYLDEGSSLVYITSTSGIRGGSGSPAYDASKAGMIGLSKAVALELGPRGIRANAVAPGPIDTPQSRGWRGAVGPRSVRASPNATEDLPTIPLGRRGTAWEIADIVLFLLSDEATYLTGQVIEVDGGRSLGKLVTA